MTNKLDPGWVNDRLPTKKDWVDGMVLCLDDKGIVERHFSTVQEGEVWCSKPLKKVALEVGKRWSDVIASPQECLDRAKGEEFPDEYRDAIGGKDEMLSLKASSEVYSRERKIADDKVKELRQALAKEQAEHAETKERVRKKDFRVSDIRETLLQGTWHIAGLLKDGLVVTVSMKEDGSVITKENDS